jgi:hypothetical protein
VIGTAVMVARIATGDIEEKPVPDSKAAELGRKGGAARAAKLSSMKRKEIARRAAKTRWDKANWRTRFNSPRMATRRI